MRPLRVAALAAVTATCIIFLTHSPSPIIAGSLEESEIIPGSILIRTSPGSKKDRERPQTSEESASATTARVKSAVLGAMGNDVVSTIRVRPLSISSDANRETLRRVGAGSERVFHKAVIPGLLESSTAAADTVKVIKVLRLMGIDAHADPIVRLSGFPLDADPNDPFFSSTGAWGQSFQDLEGLHKINAPLAWKYLGVATLGAGVRVAVIDSGADSTHPDLAANVELGPDFITGQSPAPAANDLNSHGTHVAGTIAAVANNSKGIVGVAPEATIVAVRTFNANGTASFSDVAEAIDWASDPNLGAADVINMSLGGVLDYDSPVLDLMDDAIALAHDRGVVMVAAAGNENINVRYSAPASNPYVIAVSAFKLSADERASFSNFGGGISLAAPGGGDSPPPANAQAPNSSVLSLLSAQALLTVNPILKVLTTAQGQPTDPALQVKLIRYAGTSMAAPHVSGAAALWISRNPLSPTATPAERRAYPERVRQALQLGARDVGPVGFDLDSGYGYLDAEGALGESLAVAVHLSGPAGRVAALSEEDIVGTIGGAQSFQLYVALGENPRNDQFQPAGAGFGPVDDAPLVQNYDFSLFPNGTVTFKLVSGVSEARLPVYVERRYFTSPNPDLITPFRRGGTLTLAGNLTGIANFKRYRLRLIDADGNEISSSGLSPQSSTTQVNGTIGTWNTATAGLVDGQYRILLHVDVCSSGSSCSEADTIAMDPEEVGVALDGNLRSGFPLRLSTANDGRVSYDQLTVADIDADAGHKDEILVSNSTKVFVFTGSGANQSGWPQSVYSGTGNLRIVLTAPAAGELDATSSGLEVAAVACEINPSSGSLCLNSIVHVWKANGQAVSGWPRTYSGEMLSIAIADVNNDGANDILLSQGEKIHAIRMNGTALSGYPKTQPYYFTAAAVGDVDGDGAPDVVASTLFSDSSGKYQIYAYSGSGSTSTIPIQSSQGGAQYSHVALADLDDNGVLDILYGSSDGKVHVLRRNGTYLSGWPKVVGHGEAALNGVTLGDVDGDGRLEIVASGSVYADYDTYQAVSELTVLRRDGSVLFEKDVRLDVDGEIQPIELFGYGAAAIADLNDDGREEVVVASGSNWPYRTLHAYQYDGSEIAGLPKYTANVGNDSTSSPALADIAGDGKRRLVWLDRSLHLNAWDSPLASKSSKASWPQYRQSALHSARAKGFGGSGGLQSGGAHFDSALSCGAVYRYDGKGSDLPPAGFLLLILVLSMIPRVARRILG